MAAHTSLIGVDLHKTTIIATLAAAGDRDEVREYGRIANNIEALMVGKVETSA